MTAVFLHCQRNSWLVHAQTVYRNVACWTSSNEHALKAERLAIKITHPLFSLLHNCVYHSKQLILNSIITCLHQMDLSNSHVKQGCSGLSFHRYISFSCDFLQWLCLTFMLYIPASCSFLSSSEDLFGLLKAFFMLLLPALIVIPNLSFLSHLDFGFLCGASVSEMPC